MLQSGNALLQGLQRGLDVVNGARGNPLAEAQLAQSMMRHNDLRPMYEAQARQADLNSQVVERQLRLAREGDAEQQFYELERDAVAEYGGLGNAFKDRSFQNRFVSTINAHPQAQEYLGGRQLVGFEVFDASDPERLGALGFTPEMIQAFVAERGGDELMIPIVRNPDGSTEPLEDPDDPGALATISDIEAWDIGRSLFTPMDTIGGAFDQLDTGGQLGGTTTVTYGGGAAGQGGRSRNPLAAPPVAPDPREQLPITQVALEAANRVAPVMPAGAEEQALSEQALASQQVPADGPAPVMDPMDMNRGRELRSQRTPRPPVGQLGNPNPEGAQAPANAYSIHGDNYQNNFDQLANTIEHLESRGQHVGATGSTAGKGEVTTSDAGAVGVMQVLPSTAKEVANDLGIEWDPRLFMSATPEGEAYNRQIGREYLRQQVERYDGDAVLGALAYHSGPGNVNKFLREIGDPRTGEISHAEFIRQLPGPKGRAYAAQVAGVELPGEATTSLGKRVVNDKPVAAGSGKRALGDDATLADIRTHSTQDQVLGSMEGVTSGLTPGADATYRVSSDTGRPNSRQIAQALRLVATGWLDRAEAMRYIDTGVLSADAVQLVQTGMQQSANLAGNEITQRYQTQREALSQAGQTERERIKQAGLDRRNRQDNAISPSESREEWGEVFTIEAAARGMDEDAIAEALPTFQQTMSQMSGLFPEAFRQGQWNNNDLARAQVRLRERSQEYADAGVLGSFRDLARGNWREALIGRDDPELYRDPVAVAIEAQNPVMFETEEGVANYVSAAQRYRDMLNGEGLADQRNNKQLEAQTLVNLDRLIRSQGTSWDDAATRDDLMVVALDAARSEMPLDAYLEMLRRGQTN